MVAQLLSIWEGLDGRRRLIAILAVVAVGLGVFGLARMASAPSMALLYSGLDPAAAGEIVAALEAEGVAFEVTDTKIMVDSAERDRIRMTLAARDLPRGGSAGYEILDNLSGFGTTSQMFDAAYWRAKEGELARTIVSSPNIRAARVHLANPVSQPFARAPEGSASVTVTMARGPLDEAQARAIRYLVSSAVAGFRPEAVAVIDAANGVVLAGSDEALVLPRGQNRVDREETLRANIERLLEARVGSGRAIVEVNVDATTDSRTVSERRIDPESRVAISSETEESQESSQGTTAGVTVASNLPDGDAAASGDNSSTASTSRERQNFEVSETRTERVILPGEIRRVSVAVMVDGIVEPDAAGEPVWRPRDVAEMETLRLLVQSAMGFDAERGDTVTIESLQFTLPPEQGTFAEATDGAFLEMHGARLAQAAVLGLVVLALILFVLRPMMTPRPEPALAELTGLAEVAPQPARALAPPKEDAGDALDLPPQSVTKIERLREVIASRSDDSAAVLRSWIESPEPLKEPAQS